MSDTFDASQGDAVARLFAHWRGEAEYDFRSERDAVNSQFSLVNRYCSSAHFEALSKAVETATTAMLTKARKLPIAAEAYDLANANAAALFDALALQVSPTAIDPQGRYQDCHTEDYAANAIGEARQRVMAMVESWKLEAQVKGQASSPQASAAPADEGGQYLRLWLENEATAARRSVENLLGSIDAKAAADGWYQSGGRIKKSVQIFDKHLSELWVSCFAKARSLPQVQGGHDMASATVASVFRGFAAKALKIVESAAGAKATNKSAYDATDRLMQQLWSDFERASELARFEHEAAIAATFPTAIESHTAFVPKPQRLPRGRPKGSGSFASKDAPLVCEIKENLSSGGATSIHSAAMAVAHKAAGSATIESKRDRLVRRIRSENK